MARGCAIVVVVDDSSTNTVLRNTIAAFDPTAGLAARRVALEEVEVSVLESGHGGRPLLLVHGFTGSKEDFGAEVVRFAELGFHVVAPDHRGHGASDQPDDEAAYGFDIFAADLIALANVLGWERFDVVGHSMGGMIVQRLALVHPERIDRVVLMDTHHGAAGELDPDVVELGTQLARTQGLRVIHEILRSGADPLANPAYQRLCDTVEGYEAWCDAKFLACSPAMFATMLRTFHETADRLEELRLIGAPTLVVVGELDEPFRAASERMAATIPDAQLVVIPGGGHCPQFEATEAWRAALDEFLLADR